MSDSAKEVSRRAFLHRICFAGAAGALLASCRSENADQVGAAAAGVAPNQKEALSCTDVSGLTEEQIQTRKSLQYVDRSPHSDKRCNNCSLFKAPASGKECGRCQVVPGPVHPKGYCTAWSASAG